MRSYDADYAGWAEDTARAICDGRWSEIDREHLADEVADLARKERRAIRSRFKVLFLHLLKQQYQPFRAHRSWEVTILNQRLELKELLRENPSLVTKEELIAAQSHAYQAARLLAVKETGLPPETFPPEMPFTQKEIWGDLIEGLQ